MPFKYIGEKHFDNQQIGNWIASLSQATTGFDDKNAEWFAIWSNYLAQRFEPAIKPRVDDESEIGNMMNSMAGINSAEAEEERLL